MIADGLWTPYSRRKPRIYQPRYRRDCLGELIQKVTLQLNAKKAK